MVGDGSYLMMAQELVTAVAEGVKLIVVLVQNHGFASIGALSETGRVAALRHGYRYRDASGRLDGDVLPIDLAANAASLGADVLRGRRRRRSCATALATAEASDRDHRRARSRPTRWSPRAGLARRGGTCRSPRSPRWTSSTAAARADVREGQARPSARYL